MAECEREFHPRRLQGPKLSFGDRVAAQCAEESENSTEISVLTEISIKLKLYRSEAPPFDLVVQSTVRDLSACHVIVLRV